MENPHYHLLFNHLPILIPFIGLLIMLGNLYFKSIPVQRTALLVFVLGGITTFVAHESGEGAEHALKNDVSISHDRIEKHEEAAEPFTICNYLLGVLALVALWASIKQKSFANYLAYGSIVLALFSFFFSYQTGVTGGEIRHPEIRTEASSE
jgi:hypothetical protein